MDDPLLKTFDLLKEVRAGSDAALNELFRRYRPRVLKLVRLRMGRRLRERMESGDVVQETLLEAFKNLATFEHRDEASFLHWLAKLAHHRLLHAHEHENAHKRSRDRELSAPPVIGTGSAEVEIDHVADTMVPLDKAIQAEAGAAVAAALEELPEKYREFLILRNFSGLSFQQIAQETGRETEGAARMMHAKAMLELAKILKRKGHGAAG